MIAFVNRIIHIMREGVTELDVCGAERGILTPRTHGGSFSWPWFCQHMCLTYNRDCNQCQIHYHGHIIPSFCLIFLGFFFCMQATLAVRVASNADTQLNSA